MLQFRPQCSFRCVKADSVVATSECITTKCWFNVSPILYRESTLTEIDFAVQIQPGGKCVTRTHSLTFKHVCVGLDFRCCVDLTSVLKQLLYLSQHIWEITLSTVL